MTLERKRILITGASSGIGLTLTKKLLAIEGTQIVGVARNTETLKQLNHPRLFPLSLDIAQPQNVDTMLDEAIRLMGGVDIVIASAGFAYFEQFEGRDYPHIARIFETNVLSPLYTLQQLLNKTAPDQPVSFTVLSSALGKMGLPGYALYCATKYALDGFIDSFRFEPHPRLHVMGVYPIGVNTPFWDHMDEDMPLPRPLQSPQRVADAIIKGLKKEKQRAYTSALFRVAWALNRVFPFMFYGYQRNHQRKFFAWLKKQH